MSIAIQEVATLSRNTINLWKKSEFSEDEIVEAVARVNRGAVLLDEQRPDWVEQIIPDKIDMSNASMCVIGQVYGDYEEYIGVPFGMSLEEFEGAPYEFCDEYAERAIEHGFLTETTPPGGETSTLPYDLLDRVWSVMIAERSVTKTRIVLQVPA